MKPTYRLISKPGRIKYTKYNGGGIRLNLFAPYTYEEVVVGIEGTDKVKKITTFRDSKGNITERVFDFPGKPIWNRLYESEKNDIGIYEHVTSTIRRDYTLDRNLVDKFKSMPVNDKKRYSLWNHFSTTTDHVSHNFEKDELIQTNVSITQESGSPTQNHVFIEYPRIRHGIKVNVNPRKLSFDVRKSDNSVIETTISASEDRLIPDSDIYLGYRALPINDAKIPFVNRYLRERKMDDKGIEINTEYNPRYYANSEFNAIFDAENGVINFNKDAEIYSKSRLANTSCHEAEHVWHYFLQALLNGGGTPWQTEMSQKFGRILGKRTLKEAKNYDRSIKTYVHYYEDFSRYKRNYIEIKAKQKGRKEQDNYDYTGVSIRHSFKHVPAKFL